ncbi:diaminopimelate decarboxylase [Candidatus Tachikawaea gelatinosa]|uniref:Diaminopimelate decarboxylase n=1 Tax=Candidatus Tachikawaea gelatinosa TaxID=1410383 RepID=A0A090AQU7_9ENTR|nr:diaminopimelate decarboxylase [Candidatus Tachikawaea gelatinosa]BAP58722.1 diaminopimelate decarboxylase [Candidatus Tachikawaea gelatinosa]
MFTNIKKLLKIAKYYKQPFWVYDANIIYKKIHQLKLFDTIRFAQKSCSNINILKFMKNLNVKIDAVSLGEIERALIAGYQTKNHDIVFTADLFDIPTLNRINELKIPVNAGSIDMLHQLGRISPGHLIWIRINPGFGHGHNKKTNTGGINSKHGIWYTDVPIALSAIKKYQLRLIGIHMHIGSGVNYYHLKKVCKKMEECVLSLNHDIKIISAGGGLTVPYKKTDKAIDTKHYFDLWNLSRKKISSHLGHKVHLEIEPGRFLIAESGLLVTQVFAVKKIYKRYFVLVNAGFTELMRPLLYGSYHNISIIKENGDHITEKKSSQTYNTVIGGPLCESGDIFTQTEDGTIKDRMMPKIVVGDYLIFHNTGAYGASMSSNYNSRPLVPEIFFKENQFYEIRRSQTIQELLNLELNNRKIIF